MLVCTKCWERKEDCKCNNQLDCVEIDDKIYPAIKKLNLLGYTTIFCCEGHTDNGTIQSYIYFKCNTDDKMFDNLPEGWYYEYYNYRKIKHYKYNIIRSVIPNGNKIKKLTKDAKEEIINTNIFNLINWVETLPKR